VCRDDAHVAHGDIITWCLSVEYFEYEARNCEGPCESQSFDPNIRLKLGEKIVMENPSSGKSALGLEPNVAAGLCYAANLVCYLGLVMSIIVVVTDKTNKLARFHAFQSIFLAVLGIVLGIVYFIGASVGVFIDQAIGFPLISLVLVLVLAVIGLVLLVGVIIACIKAFQGQIFKLPVIGGFADKFSG